MEGKEMRQQIQDVMDDRNQGYKDATHPTIFKKLLESHLPQQEKTIDRLQDEGVTLVGAGQETVKATLTIATYHILQKPSVLQKLKEELLTHFPNLANPPELSKLEQLPYLSACIQEGKYLNFAPQPVYRVNAQHRAHYHRHSAPPLLRPHIETSTPRPQAPPLRHLHHPRPYPNFPKSLQRAPQRDAIPGLAFLRPGALAREPSCACAVHAGRRRGPPPTVAIHGGIHEGLADVPRYTSGACAAVHCLG